MCEYRATNGTRSFSPDDTDKKFYTHEQSISSLIEIIKEKFGDAVDLENVMISSENIQVSCLGYDLYDGSDYMNFLVVELEA
jgi:hypothetical protein